jgi:hypothetical protein
MGSTDTDSMDELHKAYFNDDAKLYATCAGRVEMASELEPMFIFNIKELPRRSQGMISEALNVAVHGHRVQHFTWDVLAQRHSFLRSDQPGKLPIVASQEAQILADWQNYDHGTHLLVGTFDDDGHALLYFIGKQYDQNDAEAPGLVHLREYPGHATIGAGAYNAQFWLNWRQQASGQNIRQSAYHAYEASMMASTAK